MAHVILRLYVCVVLSDTHESPPHHCDMSVFLLAVLQRQSYVSVQVLHWSMTAPEWCFVDAIHMLSYHTTYVLQSSSQDTVANGPLVLHDSDQLYPNQLPSMDPMAPYLPGPS